MPRSLPAPRGNALRVAAAALVFGAALLALCLHFTGGGNAALWISVLIMLVAGSVAVRRFRRCGIEPLGLFCAAFSLYDGLLLFRLATNDDTSELPYPVAFSDATYIEAGTLCLLAAVSILITTAAWEHAVEPFLSRASRSEAFVQLHRAAGWSWFLSGAAIYLGGLVLYFLQMSQFGGYLALLAFDRGSRFEMAASPEHLSYPYAALVVPGLAGMAYGAALDGRRISRHAFYFLFAVWCILGLLQGDRRVVLQAALTVLGVWIVVNPSALKLTLKRAMLLGAIYLAFAFFGYSRVVIPELASGRRSASEALVDLTDIYRSDWGLPEHTELAGPYLSLLTAVSQDSGSLDGSSYYESIPAILPRFLYPEKPELLTRQFDTEMAEGSGTVYGWGFNPVAEAYRNFGVIGIPPVFVLWTLLFLGIGELSGRGEFGTLCCGVWFSEAVHANRIDFRDVYYEVAYFLGGLILAAVVQKLIAGAGRVRATSFTAREEYARS